VTAEPGVHGEVVAGTHGAGVGVPIAAAVAAATVGFDWVVHMPKTAMFAIGAKLLIVASGMSPAVMPVGGTVSVEGARPKEHCRLAPEVTRGGIRDFLLR
jgi:hypothetical protein